MRTVEEIKQVYYSGVPVREVMKQLGFKSQPAFYECLRALGIKCRRSITPPAVMVIEKRPGRWIAKIPVGRGTDRKYIGAGKLFDSPEEAREAAQPIWEQIWRDKDEA
jgi:hypothetical protein